MSFLTCRHRKSHSGRARRIRWPFTAHSADEHYAQHIRRLLLYLRQIVLHDPGHRGVESVEMEHLRLRSQNQPYSKQASVAFPDSQLGQPRHMGLVETLSQF